MKLFFELVRSVSAKQSPVLFEAFDTLVRRGFEVEYGIAQETMRPDLMVGLDHYVPVSHTEMTLRLGGLLDADGARLLEPYRFVHTRDEPFASPSLRPPGSLHRAHG